MLLAERTFDINISSKFISSNYLRGKIDGLHNKKQQKDMILLVTIQTFLHQLSNLSDDFIFVRDKCALINSLLLRLTLIVSINMRCAF